MTAQYANVPDPCFDLFAECLDADAADLAEEPTQPVDPTEADTLPYGTPRSRTERYLLIRERARLSLRSRASLGFVDSPCCDDPGPHEDNGCTGSQRAFACAACGLHFDLDDL